MNALSYPKKIAALLCLFSLLLASCASVKSKYYKDTKGLMYGMIYDAEGNPVQDVAVFIDDKLIVFSDVQGRFILTFTIPAKTKKENSNYAIRLVKTNYETITASPAYYTEPHCQDSFFIL